MRYLYQAFVIAPYPANGSHVVWNYSGTLLQKVSNGIVGRAPQAGDVFSYGPTSTNGHTSVVTGASVNGSGNGTVNVLEENGDTDGMQTLNVTSWTVSGNVSGLLHYGSAAPAMLYDVGNGSASAYRWANPAATNFTDLVVTNTPAPFDVANIGDRLVSGEFDGDDRSDLLVAIQNANGTFDFKVSSHEMSTFVWWYTSGAFSLSRLAGRLVACDWDQDGNDDVAMAYDNNNGTFGLSRWASTGRVRFVSREF